MLRNISTIDLFYSSNELPIKRHTCKTYAQSIASFRPTNP